jgi:hypothetical protein
MTASRGSSFRFALIGLLFGIVMTQSQAISWYRIHEMFRFRSFHMYGIIGTALACGLVATRIIRRSRARDFDGAPIVLPDKAPGWKRYLLGGFVFGLGWALAGACPGPIYILLGHGFLAAGVILLAAIAGTLAYGFLQPRLPH